MFFLIFWHYVLCTVNFKDWLSLLYCHFMLSCHLYIFDIHTLVYIGFNWLDFDFKYLYSVVAI